MVNIVRRAVLLAMTVIITGGFFLAEGRMVLSPAAWAQGLPVDAMARVRGLVKAGELHNQRLALLVELGRALGRTNPERGAEVLEAVWGRLDLSGAAEAHLTGKRLEHAFLWARPEDKAAARMWAGRLDATARPIGLMAELAAAWLTLNPDRADEVIRSAVPLVRRNPRSMDLELRMLSGLAVAVDRPLAESLAAAIRQPEIRSWAYRSMGRHLSRHGESSAAASYFGLALQSAAQTVEPLQRVLATVETAEAWSELDSKQGELVFDEATHLVGRIEKSEYTAYALSRLGSAWGRINIRKAFELALSIPPEHGAERVRIYLDVAEATDDSEERRGLLEEAHREALHLAGNYERERTLGLLARWMAPLDMDRAQEFLLEMNPESGFFTAGVWQALACSAVSVDVPRAVDLAEHINDKFVKVTTLAFLAEKVYAIDEAEGLRILEAGQRSAETLQQAGPQAALAVAWATYSGEKACQSAALVIGYEDRARAYARVAGRLKALGHEAEAARAWESALATALDRGLGDDLLRARTLKAIADLWAPWAPDQAEIVYETACRITAG